MKISSKKYPLDIILFILWSIILLPILLIKVENIFLTIISLPFLLFFPGYLLIFALFPTNKPNKGIDFIERIALSFGLSIVIIAFIGFTFIYTNERILSEYVIISIFTFILCFGLISFYRWKKLDPNKRFNISINLSIPKIKDKKSRYLITLFVALLLITFALFIFVISTPKIGDKYTGVYVLDSDGSINHLPRTITAGENNSLIIGVTNHEYKTISYTIEIWLINQTKINDEIIYNNAWFIDKINVTLDHESINENGQWIPQWEHKILFKVNKTGENFKMEFLLYKEPTNNYKYNEDYKNIIEEKIDNAYERLYLWFTVI